MIVNWPTYFFTFLSKFPACTFKGSMTAWLVDMYMSLFEKGLDV